VSIEAPRLHVERDGDGPLVALAHGFAGSARNFGPQARALRSRFRVIRYDARGHARSEAPDDPSAYTSETFARDLERVIDAPTAVAGGLSMGASTALRFALAHPDRVRACCSRPSPRSWEGSRLRRRPLLMRSHPPHGLVPTLRGVLAKQPSVEDLIPRPGGLAMPALVIDGDRDRASLEPSPALAAALPSAQLVVVPGAGHIVNLEQPAAFNAALAAFLDRLGE
jgi:pimeloyl-ACP methyl ester carboxylesterase